MQTWEKAVIGIAAVGVAYFVFKTPIDNYLKTVFPTTTVTQTGGGTTTGTQTTTTTTGVSKYPVTIYSAPADILQAFTDSGYLANLQASVNSGMYPQSYITALQADPANWLGNHTYLYDAYPSYFKKA
jgi:hypothetical protein